MFKVNNISLIITFMSIAGCAVTPYTDEQKNKPLTDTEKSLFAESTTSYVREVTREESYMSRRVNYVGPVRLVDIFSQITPDLTMAPLDPGVDITRAYNVQANDMSLGDFFRYMESLSGYEIKISGRNVEIRSFVTKEWNLATFANKRDATLSVGGFSGGGSMGEGGTGNINGTFSEDEWKNLVENTKKLLQNGKQNESSGLESFVHDVRSLGVIRAGGDPYRIGLADQFLTHLKNSSTRQINIDVQAYDVTLNDDQAAGINWNQLSNLVEGNAQGSLNGNQLGFKFENSTGSVIPKGTELFNAGITLSGGKGTADATLRYLRTYGEVELINQPNVTVRNGTYAYISAGEEEAYIGDIEIIDDEDTDPVASFKFDKIRFGVRLVVAPRILDDNRVLLDIWPIISSLKSFEKFEVLVSGDKNNAQSVSQPELALQELSTEVITESGKPIQLGGFIRRVVTDKLQELPWRHKATGKIVNFLFRQDAQTLERRELVLMVTPTVVQGG